MSRGIFILRRDTYPRRVNNFYLLEQWKMRGNKYRII